MRPDWMTPERCAVCARIGEFWIDEVSGTVFCRDHAGPLAWSDRDVNLYSAALRIGGYLDRPVALPDVRARAA